MSRYLVGVDPGVKTGVAVWDRKRKKFQHIMTTTITYALGYVSSLIDNEGRGSVEVRYEDARKRKWFGRKGREALQGAGSIKRDCSIWEEYLTANDINHKAIAPQANTTKLSAAQFEKMTGYKLRTSEHARDAAMLVYQG